MDSQAHPLPHGLSWSSPLCSVRFPRDISFLIPLACWWTLIVVLSSISVVSSTKSCPIRAVRISSHIPAFVHARNRLYTLCHGPNRSGRSRHGIPVFSQYRILLSISQLLFPGRPPCGREPGNGRIFSTAAGGVRPAQQPGQRHHNGRASDRRAEGIPPFFLLRIDWKSDTL